VIDETQQHIDIAGMSYFMTGSRKFDVGLEKRPWDRPVATLQVPGHPLTMVFHSYDKHLFIANESDVVRLAIPVHLVWYPHNRVLSVWDWSQRRRLSSFHNGNPSGTSVTSLQVINQDVGGIILTGSCKSLSVPARKLLLTYILH
jgi:regulator-associated protein of mTOR